MDRAIVLRIVVFVLISYLAAFALDYVAMVFAISMSLWGFARMWSVALSSLLCSYIFRTNASKSFKHYFLVSRKVLRYYLLTPLIVYAALLLYIVTALPLGLFNFGTYVDLIAKQIRSVSQSLGDEEISTLASLNAYLTVIVAYPAAITINAVFALGEEIGWRGYLYTTLGSRPNLVNTITIGVIWGLWHTSATILLGWNYYFNRYLGVILFTLWTTVLTYPLLVITSATNSVIPASALHGAVNALWSLTNLASDLPVHTREIMLGLGILGILVWLFISLAIYTTTSSIQKKARNQTAGYNRARSEKVYSLINRLKPN